MLTKRKEGSGLWIFSSETLPQIHKPVYPEEEARKNSFAQCSPPKQPCRELWAALPHRIAGTLLRFFSSSVLSVTSVVDPDEKRGQPPATGYGSKTRRT